VIYDPANLPLSINAAGVTTTFRYDHGGQRITKQKTGQDTQVYLRDGATVLGVVNVNGSGTATAAYFNLTWDGRVIGRQTVLPLPATRTYDHFDALETVRAVVSTTGAVQESYDYEPWGLLMPGRTLTTATPTKEGFTGKEQDAETGLNYFGARYYMAAVGRWSAVDPLMDKTAQWSGYVYVMDNPLALVDILGLQACAPDPEHFSACTIGSISYGMRGGEEAKARIGPVRVHVGASAGVTQDLSLTGDGRLHSKTEETFSVGAGAEIRALARHVSIGGAVEGTCEDGLSNCQVTSTLGTEREQRVGRTGEVKEEVNANWEISTSLTLTIPGTPVGPSLGIKVNLKESAYAIVGGVRYLVQQGGELLNAAKSALQGDKDKDKRPPVSRSPNFQ
jgi:RHS repeat-associated protein